MRRKIIWMVGCLAALALLTAGCSQKGDEEQPGYEKGFISTALIQKHTSLDEVTFFLCGPKAIYDFPGKELAPLNLPVKAAHRDATCCSKTPASSSAPCTCRTRSMSSPPRQTRPC